MAYDPGRDRIVMFGGIGVGGAVLGDTWEWDGGNWLPAAPPTQPPARRSFPLIYHPLRGTVVLWGGYSTQDLSDMWEYNGIDWLPIQTLTTPPPRRASEMAFDPVGLGIVLFSGYLQGSDTWYFDGVDWRQRQPAMQPPARYDTWLVYDLLRGHTVLFGGNNGIGDTWVYAPTTPARFHAFGSGCPGSNAQTPRLLSADLPWLDDAFEITVDRLPAAGGLTFMVIGFSDAFWGAVPLPLDLGIVGLPGCPLLVEPAVTYPLLAAGGTATWTLLLPNAAALLGARFYNQAAANDPAANPGGFTVSNGGASTVGGR